MDKESTASKSAAGVVKTALPIVVDVGKASKKAIRRLKEGTGKLMAQVDQAIEEVRVSLPDEDKGKPFIPVIVVYRKKRKKGSPLPLPFSPLNLFR